MIIQESPTVIRLTNLPEKELRNQLTYIDKSVDFELSKARNNKWLLKKLGTEQWREHLAQLKAKRTQCLLFEDEKGFWTYSGLGWWLANKFNVPFVNQVKYPEPKSIPWSVIPDKTPRSYQKKIHELLLEHKHAGVEVGTGLGKSFSILLLAKALGLKTVVMTPSVSIAEQIHKEFLLHLGSKYVGQFFDGKKDSKKLFVIAVDDSLTKVEKGSDHWKNLVNTQVFIADESHLCPAKSLAKVCLGLLANAPYRFFFSGTQLRNDGLDLLLDAITGKIVYRMTVKDGVDQGYLAKPMFRMVRVDSSTSFNSNDANDMTRNHLFYNKNVNKKAAEIANLMVEEMNRKVIILVKELKQFTSLLPYLKHKTAFAHGGVTKTNKNELPEQYWDSDPNALVKEFDEGNLPILVGTSCITTGTDIQTVGAIIFLRGGKSEIDIKQSVGRGTRKPVGKNDCYFIDFNVDDVEILKRHAAERASIYQDIYPDFEELIL